jgi:hypothetical protein
VRPWHPPALLAAALLGAALLHGDTNPPPSLSPYAAYPPFSAAAINQPFPDSVYGADHAGSTVTLTFPFTSPFGNTDHSHGVVTYTCAPFTPRRSEGIYGMDVWLEQQDASGGWSPAFLNGGVPDQGSTYQAVNTPNPGPSPSFTYTWTYSSTPLPAQASLRVFVYVYLYNQGGGNQGNFFVASAAGPVATGPANDPPRIQWSPSTAALNPSQVQAGQSYVVSADAQDDNGNLSAVSINRNGQPFAYAGGGNGYSGNSQNPSAEAAGSVTYTAWATDSAGASTAPITLTVTDLGRSAQPPVFSADATLGYYTAAFTPEYHGGSGSGAWQFAIAGFTNWTVGTDSNAGTQLWPSGLWSPDWMPPAPGSYCFWIARDGDAATFPSAPAGLYTLTVTASPPVGSFDSVSPSVPAGQAVIGSGWAGDPQMGAPVASVRVLVDGGSLGSLQASLGAPRPDVAGANLAGGHWSPLDLTSSGWSFSLSTAAIAPGPHSLTAIADNSYGLSTPLGTLPFSVTVPPQPPTAAIAATPSSGTAPLTVTVSWTTTAASSVQVSGSGLSSTASSGNAAVTLSSAGTFVYSLAASGPGGQASQSASVSVAAPPQPQTISFTPPSQIPYPGPGISLGAAASSGLPVTLVIVSGPGSLQGTSLTPTGVGPIVIEALQAGNGSWLPAASVIQTIQALAPPAVVRIRFGSAGTDARVGRPGGTGSSTLRTDPSGLARSPWPSLANPAALVPQPGAFNLPAVPAAR